ncbi:hypothetical protein ELH84_06705 [Rhizobium ruizarguesonis]|nr:hypothetical protein ELH84_06705 [Rhizobium ruizarguesonis]
MARPRPRCAFGGAGYPSRPQQPLEHDAEKCERFSDDIMLYFFDLDRDSDFRPIGPKIILI